MEQYQLKIYKDRNGKFRFRIIASNGRIVAKSPGTFDSPDDLVTGDATNKGKIYQDRAGEWRWRLKFNGKIICVASEGYVHKKHSVTMLRNIYQYLKTGEF